MQNKRYASIDGMVAVLGRKLTELKERRRNKNHSMHGFSLLRSEVTYINQL